MGDYYTVPPPAGKKHMICLDINEQRDVIDAVLNHCQVETVMPFGGPGYDPRLMIIYVGEKIRVDIGKDMATYHIGGQRLESFDYG